MLAIQSLPFPPPFRGLGSVWPKAPRKMGQIRNGSRVRCKGSAERETKRQSGVFTRFVPAPNDLSFRRDFQHVYRSS